MKTAIYIDAGVTQLVITPETEWERTAIQAVGSASSAEATLKKGEFYECQGGFLRHGSSEQSLIIRIDKPQP